MPDIEITMPVRTKAVLEDPSRDIVVIAHRRWIKTIMGIHKCMFGNEHGHKGAIKDPNTNYFIVLPTYKQAKMVAWNILKDRSLPFKAKPNETELTVIYPNHSQISLKGSDKPDSLRGPGLDGLVLDEWAFHEKPEVSTRILRPALADRKGWRLKTTTLNGENHAWDDYILAGSRYMFKASESGVLSEDELQLMREEMSEDEYFQEMECIPLHLSGAIYKEFDESRHVIREKDYFAPDDCWTFLIGLDWGISHNCAICFCAVDYDGNFIVWDEIVESEKPVDYYVPLIKAKMIGKKYDFFVSPDTLRRDKFRQGVQYSVFQEFNEQGLNPLCANDQVSGGINKIKQILASGKIKIFERCSELIAGIKRYKWKQSEGHEEPAKIRDDEVDAFRYAVATYFEQPVMSNSKSVAEEMSIVNIKRNYDYDQGIRHHRRVKEYAHFK